MAIRSSKNEYHGINAHLHSYFQSKGGWSSFHTSYITDLAKAIDAKLPLGYLVDLEQSLQIREFHTESGERLRKPTPDITIYDTQPSTQRPISPEGGTTATLVQPVIDTIELDEQAYYTAILIYAVGEDESLGRAITRIELLSPTNKSGEGYLQYREKRATALRIGVGLIEIDYLHETDSPIKGVPSYSRRQPGSHAYTITVNDPKPSLEKGLSKTFGFSVDDPIPMIDIPLAGEESLSLDFGAVYNQTFVSLGAYSHRVDYEQLPENFQSYNEADQERIREVMRRVVSA